MVSKCTLVIALSFFMLGCRQSENIVYNNVYVKMRLHSIKISNSLTKLSINTAIYNNTNEKIYIQTPPFSLYETQFRIYKKEDNNLNSFYNEIEYANINREQEFIMENTRCTTSENFKINENIKVNSRKFKYDLLDNGVPSPTTIDVIKAINYERFYLEPNSVFCNDTDITPLHNQKGYYMAIVNYPTEYALSSIGKLSNFVLPNRKLIPDLDNGFIRWRGQFSDTLKFTID